MPHALYNIGNSRSEDLMRVVELLEQATGRKALLDPQPMQPGDVKDTFADISAIERDLGFVPRPPSTKGFRVSSHGTATTTPAEARPRGTLRPSPDCPRLKQAAIAWVIHHDDLI